MKKTSFMLTNQNAECLKALDKKQGLDFMHPDKIMWKQYGFRVCP